jgi:hypothetical protein
MIESVAAVMSLVSAGIFLAHAIEGYSAHPHAELRQGRVPKSSMIWASIETGR